MISSCLIPSFFAVLYGNGVLLLRWYIGFRIAGLNWVVESLYTSEKIFDIIFCLIILGIGIFVLIIGLINKKHQETINDNILFIIGFTLIMLTIMHTIYFYWEALSFDSTTHWIPILPILLVAIGVYFIKNYFKNNRI